MHKPEKPSQASVPKQYQVLYLVFAIIVLLVSVGVWAVLSARLQLANADQLVNSFLFDQLSSVTNAILPVSHTFLLKWPLFLLVGTHGATSTSFIVATVGLVYATVIGIAIVLYRITSKPLLIGTILLALASALLLTPTVPYSGALLPVNMAMIATRNIEYITYILSLIFIIRARRILGITMLFATLLLAFTIASDRLFLILSLGGSLCMLIIYGIRREQTFTRIAKKWFVSTLIATLLSTIGLYAIKHFHVTNITSANAAGSPYGLITSLHDFALGSIYAVLGIFTNFGANPAYSATKLADIPSQVITHLLRVNTLGYLINVSLMLVGVVLVSKLLWATLKRHKPNGASRPQTPVALSIMLCASALVAIGSFVLAAHYYPADARYLSIILFAVVIGATTYANKLQWSSFGLIIMGILIFIGMIAGSAGVFYTYREDKAAVSIIDERASSINQALSSHQVDYLVGDYWRILPVRLQPDNKFQLAPLENCTQFRQTLTSTQWQPDLKNHSFAYLLTFDKSLTDYPNCDIETIGKTFGVPTATTLIAGTVEEPKEMLLFYDGGINTSDDSAVTPSTQPIPLADMPNVTCPNGGKTLMNIVAHEDDDLLFTSPDLLGSVDAGDCIRTIYLTAGDAGNDQYYWIGREEGSEAAYAQMANIRKENWVQRTIRANPSAYFVVSNHPENIKLSVIFMQLPDGNLNGSGFARYNYNSLANMMNKTGRITSVDGQSTYTTASLEATLQTLMEKYKPDYIRTLSTYNGPNWPDHSDHHQTSIITHQVFNQYAAANNINPSTVPVTDYMGYPVRLYPVNVTGEPFTRKLNAFLAYSQQDPAVCHTEQDCFNTPTYWGYLQRQYPTPDY